MRAVGGAIWERRKTDFSIYLPPPFSFESYPIIGNSIPRCNESFDGNQSQLAAISLDPAEKEYVIFSYTFYSLYHKEREKNKIKRDIFITYVCMAAAEHPITQVTFDWRKKRERRCKGGDEEHKREQEKNNNLKK